MLEPIADRRPRRGHAPTGSSASWPRRLLAQPIALRQPFIFYLGHLPAFAWNHVRRLLGAPPFDARLDELFARGIDPRRRSDAVHDIPRSRTAGPPWPRSSRTAIASATPCRA